MPNKLVLWKKHGQFLLWPSPVDRALPRFQPLQASSWASDSPWLRTRWLSLEPLCRVHGHTTPSEVSLQPVAGLVYAVTNDHRCEVS